MRQSGQQVKPSTPNMIVSANYRDRGSKTHPWLVRGYRDGIGAAVPHQAVIARGVRFQGSNRSESGFGCTVVAGAESAEGFTAENMPKLELGPNQRLAPLRFCGYWFQDKTTGAEVPVCDVLMLMPDGSMTAYVPVEVPAEQLVEA